MAQQQAARGFFHEKRKFNYITLGLLAVVIVLGALAFFI